MVNFALLIASLGVALAQPVPGTPPVGVVPLPPFVSSGNSPPLCAGFDEHPSNMVFLVDLSSSVEDTVDSQLAYTKAVIEKFDEMGSTATRFGISAYSKYTNVVRSLEHQQSNDVDRLTEILEDKNALKNMEWDNPAGGYEFLAVEGKRFAAISRAFRNTRNVLSRAQQDEDNYGTLSVIVLFTDGHPQNHEYRYRSSNGWFWKSLGEAREARDELRSLNMKTHVHCVMVKSAGFYTQVFFSGTICDSHEEIAGLSSNEIPSPAIYQCGQSGDAPNLCQENVCN